MSMLTPLLKPKRSPVENQKTVWILQSGNRAHTKKKKISNEPSQYKYTHTRTHAKEHSDIYTHKSSNERGNQQEREKKRESRYWWEREPVQHKSVSLSMVHPFTKCKTYESDTRCERELRKGISMLLSVSDTLGRDRFICASRSKRWAPRFSSVILLSLLLRLLFLWLSYLFAFHVWFFFLFQIMKY